MQTVSLPPKLPALDINIGLDLLSRREFWRYRSTGRLVQQDPNDKYYFHQKIVQQFMMYNDHLMLIHEAGSGRSKTALSVMKSIQDGGFLEHLYKRIVIATPNDELARAWGTNSEITESDKSLFQIMTHYEMSTKDPKDYDRTIFIVDEVHKLANETVLNTTTFSRNDNKKDMVSKYGGVWNLLHKSKMAKVMLLTATPFQNDVADFYPLLNLILPMDKQVDRRISSDAIAERMVGRVSFVRNVYQDIKIEYDMSNELYRKIQEFQLAGSRSLNDVLGLYGNSSLATLSYKPGTPQTYRLPFFAQEEFKTTMFSMTVADYITALFYVDNNRQVSLEKTVPLSDGASLDINMSNVIFNSYADSEGSYIEFTLTCSNFSDEILIDDVLYLTLAVPGLLRSSVPLENNTRYSVIRSILGAAHTGYLRDVERSQNVSDGQVEIDERNPDRRLIFSDEQQSFVFQNTPIEDLKADVNVLSSCSKLYYHMILFLMSTSTPENRAYLLENNPQYSEILTGDPIETGKSLFYSRYITNEYGIGFFASLLTAFGYERLTADSDIKTARPRFALSPDSNRLRDMINSEDNWDGSRCQIVLFSQRGATGFSYFDVRHIHIMPGWSPSENTQAIFRGIRSGGHKNFVSKAGYIPTIRVCIHTISPNLGQSVVKDTFYEKSVNINNKDFKNTDDEPIDGEQVSYRFGWKYNSDNSLIRTFAREVNNPTKFDKLVSYAGSITEQGNTNVYYTILGLAMRNFSNSILQRNMESPYKQVVAYNDMFNGLNSVFPYILYDSIRKDMEFAIVREKLKSHAVDCDLLKIRNTLPEGFNYTSECDYKLCTINCISESGKVSIQGNDVDIVDGSDPRRSRALAPLSYHRTTTHDHYLTLSPTEILRLENFIIDYMQENVRVSYYQLIKDISFLLKEQ